MTSVHSHITDNVMREVYLLENVSIQGRKTELRQLLKLLNLAKTGQPKAALITGDAGIGKTALLQSFVRIVREGVYCRILDLGKMNYETPEHLYIAIVDALLQESELILDEALVAVNEITEELELRWERTDLIRAIALVKLQESIGGKDAVSQDQLVKAIRSQVPAIKKLKLSVNDKVEKLVDLLVNPWVLAATSMLSPITPNLQDALKLADRLRKELQPENARSAYADNLAELKTGGIATHISAGKDSSKDTKPASKIAQKAEPSTSDTHRTIDVASAPSREILPPLSVEVMPNAPDLPPYLDEGIVSMPRPAKKKSAIIDDAVSEGLGPVRPAASASPSQTATSGVSSAGSAMAVAGNTSVTSSIQWSSTATRHPLIPHLMAILDFINHTIDGIDSGLLIVIDEWDRILNSPNSTALKEFFSDWLTQVSERKNNHMMLAVTARTEGESYTLGGAIYNHFRTKLLLDPLTESVCKKWTKSHLKGPEQKQSRSGHKKGIEPRTIEIGEEIEQQIFALSKGNPYWHFKLLNYIQERLEHQRSGHLDQAFFNKLGVTNINEISELAFTRLKLTFLNDEASLQKVIAALIKRFEEQPFSATEAIRELSTSQGLTDGYVFEVLRGLFKHDFLRPVQTFAPMLLPDGKPAPKLLTTSSNSDPYYVIHNRMDLAFLQEKTRATETDISTSEKLTYLKKIIPLSVQSGDLDRQKTMEILALGEAMGYPEIVAFLEDLFEEALRDPQPVVRVTALNNMALIDSAKARNILFAAMADSSDMVREYAAENIDHLSRRELSKIAPHPGLAEQILSVMIDSIDDESDTVRTRIYGVLGQCRNYRDLTSVFLKGLTDSCEGVRLIAIRNLVESEADTPHAFVGLLDAVNDPVSEIRRYACIGLRRYPVSEAIEAITRVLRNDSNSGLRALAADSLSRMEDGRAFPALVSALRNEESEDVKLAVVRALGKRTDSQTEAVLLESLSQADCDAMPVFAWAGIRSLGRLGASRRALNLLAHLQQRSDNTIILSAVEMARQRISARIEDLKQRGEDIHEDNEDYTSSMIMLSPRHEDVSIPEEDFLPS